MSGVLFLYLEGGMVGWLAGGREGESEAFLFLLAGVWKPLSEMSMLAVTKDNYKVGNYKIKTQRDNMF